MNSANKGISINSKLERFANAIASIEGLNVTHYLRPQKNKGAFAVWQEDFEDSAFHSSDKKQEQAVQGTLDYFTQVEFDEMVDLIQDKLNEIEGLAWQLESTQYEEETEYIHYEWRFAIA